MMFFFFDNCEELAKQKNISMNKLGEQVGVSGAAINGWKNGSYPKADVAQKVAETLGVTVDYLMTGKTDSGFSIGPKEIELLENYRKSNSDFKTIIETVAKQSSFLSNPPSDKDE